MQEESNTPRRIVIIGGSKCGLTNELLVLAMTNRITSVKLHEEKDFGIIEVHFTQEMFQHLDPIVEYQKRLLELIEEEETSTPIINYHSKYEPFLDPIFEEKIIEDKTEMKHRARQQQWSGKTYKQKNNRRTNRIAFNHGKHRKK